MITIVRNEGSKHRKAKERIALMLRRSNRFRNVITDDEPRDRYGNPVPMFAKQIVSELLVPMDFWPDVCATRYFDDNGIILSKQVIIEVDGKSHNSKTAVNKDRLRDKHFLTMGIPTIRFKVKDIVGVNMWSRDEIFDLIDKEITYQLQ